MTEKLSELELAEKLMAAKSAGIREASEYRLKELSNCISQSGASWGVADWDDVRDFINFAGKAFAESQRAARAEARPDVAALHDKIEGLESDLFSAVHVAYQRGAVEWTRLNYPAWFDRFKVGGGQPRAEARPAPAVDREAVARVLWNLATGCEPGEAWAWEKAIWIAAFWPEAFSCRDLVSKCFQVTDAILALLSPATSPGEGSSGAESAARIASDHAASETLRKSEEG